ncbi:MAG: 3-dehydroquinate synthase [Desulfovibrionaceae bacterium]
MAPARPSPASVRLSLTDSRDLSYAIDIGCGLGGHVARTLASANYGSTYAVLCDSNTLPIFRRVLEPELSRAGLRHTVHAVSAGEASKSLEEAGRIMLALLDEGFARDGCLVAFGGGMTGDLCGFVAGCYMRGVPHVAVPTTLLAMVDASVGGKTGVNLGAGKNCCGLFKQPSRVFADIDLLKTLERDEYVNGLAEAVKYAMMTDGGYARFLLENKDAILAREGGAVAELVRRCCEIKAGIVARDEHDAGVRMILNFGHTVGHALEASWDYAVRHGFCVAAGMRVMLGAAGAAGYIDAAYQRQCIALLDAFGLDPALPGVDVQSVMHHMRSDKKTLGGNIRFVVPTGPGRLGVTWNLSPELVRSELERTFA